MREYKERSIRERREEKRERKKRREESERGERGEWEERGQGWIKIIVRSRENRWFLKKEKDDEKKSANDK